jgi:hypothetical protein
MDFKALVSINSSSQEKVYRIFTKTNNRNKFYHLKTEFLEILVNQNCNLSVNKNFESMQLEV